MQIIEGIRRLPEQIQHVLDTQGTRAEKLAAELYEKKSLLVMGR